MIPLALLATVTVLSWNANTEADLAGYRVYWRTSPATVCNPSIIPNPEFNRDVGNNTFFVITQVPNTFYYYWVTAYNEAGAESDYSRQVFNIDVPLMSLNVNRNNWSKVTQ